LVLDLLYCFVKFFLYLCFCHWEGNLHKLLKFCVSGMFDFFGVHKGHILIFYTFFVVIATSFASLVLTLLKPFKHKIHSFWNMKRLFRAAKPTTTTTTTNRTFNHHFTSFFYIFLPVHNHIHNYIFSPGERRSLNVSGLL